MEIQIRLIGILLMVLALVHVVFPKYFNWKKELESLNLMNKQMMQIHTFFIALVVFLMGILCFTSSTELLETVLGKRIILGLAIFWGLRLLIQFFGYSSKLWKGKKFETIIHIIFSLLWGYISFIFLWVYFY